MKTPDVLARGVAQGIITDEQRDALLALGRPGQAPREAARAFNGITIAYGVGALVVLFAFGWFLVDRWRVLGDSGIFGLAVAWMALGYGVLQRMSEPPRESRLRLREVGE